MEYSVDTVGSSGWVPHTYPQHLSMNIQCSSRANHTFRFIKWWSSLMIGADDNCQLFLMATLLRDAQFSEKKVEQRFFEFGKWKSSW